MAVQTTIDDAPARAYAGQIADQAPRYCMSRRAEDVATTPILAGQPVLFGTDPNTQALAVTDGDTIDHSTLAGFVVLDTARAFEDAPPKEGGELSVMRMGTMRLLVTDDVSAGDQVYVGNATAQLGDIEGATGTGLVAVPGAMFLEDAASGDFALAHITLGAPGEVSAEALAESIAGEYVPTLTDTTNVAASAVLDARYMRIDNTVTVFLAVTVDVTAAAATVLDISLPVASNFAAANDCIGMMASNETVGAVAQISAQTTTNLATLTYTAVGTGVVTWRGSFSYTVI